MIQEHEWKQWQNDGLFTHPIIRLWMNTWNMRIIHQRHYGISLLPRGIGCLAMKSKKMILTRNGEIDPRMNLIYFCDSGGGKGIGQGFYQEIFKKVGLEIKSLKRPTVEKLVGSFDDNIEEKNIQKGYTPGNPKWRNPVIHGFLETCDDIIFDEAEIFFNRKDYGDSILRIARMALDPYGSPNNELESETLKNRSGYKYHCACSMAFLSYHLEDISKQILANGIFQRPLTFFYRISKEQMDDILIGNRTDISQSFKENKEKLISELKKIADYITELEHNITITQEAENYIESIMRAKLKEIYQEDTDVGDTVKSFLPRLRDNIFKMSCSFALIKKKRTITKTEVREAEVLVLGLGYNSLIREIVVHGVLAKEARQHYLDLKKALGTFPRTKEDINRIMMQYWGKSRPVVISRLKKLQDMFHSVKRGRGNTQFWKLI